MALETATYISDLVSTNPTSSDNISQGDDHIRLLKGTIKATFPNISGAVTPTHTELNVLDGLTASTTELNYVDGVTSAIQTQLDAKQPLDADLTAIAGLTSAADRLPYYTGSGTAALATFTSAGRALVDDADATAQRATLGLGTAATLNVGTSANNVVQLDGSAKLPAVDGSALTGLPGGTPSGSLVAYAGASAPSGWLLADGSAVSRTTYASLYTAIGTAWGVGDGSTTFNLPDMRGRVPVGSGTITFSETVAAASVGTTGNTFTVASNTSPKQKWVTGMPVTLTTTGSLPSPLTTGTTYYVIRASSTSIQLATSLANAFGDVDINITTQGTGNHTITTSMSSRTLAETFGVEANGDVVYHNHTSGVYSGTSSSNSPTADGSAGSALAVTGYTGLIEQLSNMQPSAVVNYIIKT